MCVCVCVRHYLCQIESVYDRVCSAFDVGAGLSSVVKLNGVGENRLNKIEIYGTSEALF